MSNLRSWANSHRVVVAVIALVVALVVALAVTTGNPNNYGGSDLVSDSSSTSSASATTSPSDAPSTDSTDTVDNAKDADTTSVSQKVLDKLTVTTVKQTCATSDDDIVAFNIGALKNQPPRKWSDALSTPMGSRHLKAAKKAICHDPLLGVTYACALTHIDGVNLAKANEWLRPYSKCTGKHEKNITKKASGFVPLLDVLSPTPEQAEASVKKNQHYQELANRINTLLGRFKLAGVHSYKSKLNWHLKNGGLAVDGLPQVGLDPLQDVRPALVLEVTLKNSECVPVRIGINMGDKRPEVFPHGCKPPTEIHGCVSNCGSGGCVTNCGPPPCVTNCSPAPCVEPWYAGTPGYVSLGNCHWKKVPHSDDHNLNHTPVTQQPQHNPGQHTGNTPGAGNGTSSPTHGGTGTSPHGGGSDGSGGTTPDTPPDDSGQGGTGGDNGGGGIVDPG